MLRIRSLAPLVKIRKISSGPTGHPFTKEDLKGDDQYSDLNDHYSDLFSAPDPVGNAQTSQSDSLRDDIAEINAELNDLYGVDTPVEVQNVNDEPVQQQDQVPLEAVQPIQESSNLSLLDKIKSSTPKIFISKSNNPFLNLAFEEFIFRNTPNQDPFTAQRLIFYTNSPCVVVGKSQNPWRETNLPKITQLGVPVLRRNSGGGTVVHDLGNVNYSYITSKESFSRTFFGKVIVDAVNKKYRFEKLKQNERGDIIMAQDGKKLSGSAFKVTRGKSYHHGTMLLNSDLNTLRKILKKDDREGIMEFKCKAVDSVPAPVSNLGLPNHEFMEVVSKAFQELHPQHDVEIVEVGEFQKEILDISEDLKKFNWVFGATPSFEMKLNYEDDKWVSFHVEKGHLKSVENSKNADDEFHELKQLLEYQDKIPFVGKNFTTYIPDEKISEWIDSKIDATSIYN